MLYDYVIGTGDHDILDRTLPLAEKEYRWSKTYRSLNDTNPYSKKTHFDHRYAVKNSASRPK